jgi:DNA-binding IclR family transcriptional regulator
VLDTLAMTGKPLRLSDLARDLNIPRASMFSILATLAEERLIERAGAGYRLGERLALLASSANAGRGLTRVSRPVLARLVAKLSESAQVAVLDEGVARYVDALEGTQTLRVATWVGKRNALARTAIGKALILETPTGELRQLVGSHADHELDRLEAEVADAREKGYTTDEGVGEAGVYCVGAPIRDASGRIMAALSVSAPEATLSPGRVREVTDAVQQAAVEISEGCGWSSSSLQD